MWWCAATRAFWRENILVNVGITDTWQQLLVLGALNVLIWGGESLFEYLLELKWRGLAQDIQHDLRLDTYAHVQKLELGFFENQRTGALMSVLNDDVNQLERFLNGGANQIIQTLSARPLMVSAVFFALQPSIAGVALLPIPVILFGAFWFQQRLAPRYAEVREAAGDVSARLNNNLLGLATIKAYTTEDFEAAHIRQASDVLPPGQCRGPSSSAPPSPR